jgi:hypothetical protein
MAESPEIPEAKDPFEKRAALTIAIIAICLSFIENLGDNAKTDAILKTNEASNQWGYFQSKSIKGQMASMHAQLLERFQTKESSGSVSGATVESVRLQKEAERYDSEKSAIKAQAESLQQQAAQQSAVNDRCDRSALFLQVAVVLCSVSIIARRPKLLLAGIGLGGVGIAIGVTAFFL